MWRADREEVRIVPGRFVGTSAVLIFLRWSCWSSSIGSLELLSALVKNLAFQEDA